MTSLRCLSVIVFCSGLRWTLCNVTFKETNNPRLEGFVVGGLPVRVEQYPFVVGIWGNPGACTGAILASHTVLTAAHCIGSLRQRPEWLYVYVGSSYIFSKESVKHAVKAFIMHPSYNETEPFFGDVGLIFLKRGIKFGPKAQPARLVNTGKWMNSKYNFEVIGHGKDDNLGPLSYDGLTRTVLAYIPHDVCANDQSNITLERDMACFGSRSGSSSFCNGDSGGGILWKRQIVGVASYYRGMQCEPTSIAVYTNVWLHRTWINKEWKRLRAKYNCPGC